MAYTPEEFQYSIRSYDSQDLSTETAEIFDIKDRQIEFYLKNELNKIKTEIAALLLREEVRFGTAVATLPAVNGFVTITYAIAFPTTFNNFAVVVSNGDYSANTPRLEVANSTRTGFRCYHAKSDAPTTTATGAAGSPFRVNYVAFAWV